MPGTGLLDREDEDLDNGSRQNAPLDNGAGGDSGTDWDSELQNLVGSNQYGSQSPTGGQEDYSPTAGGGESQGDSPRSNGSNSGGVDGAGLQNMEANAGAATGGIGAGLAGENAAANKGDKADFTKGQPAGKLAKGSPSSGATHRITQIARSKGGRNGVIVTGIITVTVALVGIGGSSLDTSHYSSNLIKKVNAAANRIIQKRRAKSIVNAVKDSRKSIAKGSGKAAATGTELIPGEQAVADAAQQQLGSEGFKFVDDGGGNLKSITFTDSAGTTGTLDMTASDLSTEVDRFAGEGGSGFYNEFIQSIESDANVLGEDFRGAAAKGWLGRLDISLNNTSLEKSADDTTKTQDEQLKDAVTHENDDVVSKPKASGESGFNDPNKDAAGKDVTPQSGVASAQESANNQVKSLADATPDQVDAAAAGEQAVDDSLAEVAGDVSKIKPTAEQLAEATRRGTGASVDPLVTVQSACKIKGAIDVANNVRRYAYAIEVIRFGMKWLAFADARKAGYSSGKANALMELWMHRPNPKTGQTFGSGGAMANAFGDKTVHASSSSLTRFSVGYAAAGVVADIANFIKPIASGCRAANNLFVNIGAAIVGVGVLVAGCVTTACTVDAAGIALNVTLNVSILIAADIVAKIVTPILIRTGAHLIMSGLESGDVLESAVASGVVGGLHGNNNAHVLTPVTVSQHQTFAYDAQQYQKQQLAKASIYERYFNIHSEDSLLGHMAVSIASATNLFKSQGATRFMAGIASSSQTKLARSIFPTSYAASSTDSLCQDKQVTDNNIAADDFCNVYNELSPQMDISETRNILLSNHEISPNGTPITTDFKEYIAQCASGQPGLLYTNAVNPDGSTGDTRTNLCIDETSHSLNGENRTIAYAFNTNTLAKPTVAWWQKAIGNSAYAAPDPNSGMLVGRNVRYAVWLAYINDITEAQQTLTGNYGTSTPATASNGQTGGAAGPVTPIVLDPANDTTNIQCSGGTDAGTNIGYLQAVPHNIRLCNVNSFVVNSQVSKQFSDMYNTALSAGLNFVAPGASGGFRTMDGQVGIYDSHCAAHNITPTPGPYPKTPRTANITCPGGAPPGYSNHQMGLAADLGCNGKLIPQDYASASTNPCFQWLEAHAGSYGFFEWGKGNDRNTGAGYEAWHWSVDGT